MTRDFPELRSAIPYETSRGCIEMNVVAIRMQINAAHSLVGCTYRLEAKLDQSAFIARFNKTYGDEVLGAYVFEPIDQARGISRTACSYCNATARCSAVLPIELDVANARPQTRFGCRRDPE